VFSSCQQQGSGTGTGTIAPGTGTQVPPQQQQPPCDVFNAAIVHVFEDTSRQTVAGSGTAAGSGSPNMNELFVRMPGDRATDEYKNRAIMYFKNQYGIDFSQNVDGMSLQALTINPTLKHFVASAYANQLPKGFTPTSNIKVTQDFWQMKIDDDRERDLEGKLKGIKLKPDQFVAYGEFQYKDGDQQVIPKIIWKTPFPIDTVKFDLEKQNGQGSGTGTGTAEVGSGTAAQIEAQPTSLRIKNLMFDLESQQMGKGLALGIHVQKYLGDKNIHQQRLVLNFPATLSEITSPPQVAEKCVKITQ
jgi:hypothetical protein